MIVIDDHKKITLSSGWIYSFPKICENFSYGNFNMILSSRVYKRPYILGQKGQFFNEMFSFLSKTILMEETSMLSNLTFLKFCSTPLSVASNLYPPAIFDVLFLWLNGLLCHIWCVFSLNDIMDLQMSSLGTLVPEQPCYVFHTHIPKDKQHTQQTGPTKSLDAFEFLFFDSAGEASKDIDTFLNLRVIKKQKPAVFLRKYFKLTSSKLRMFHWMYLTFCRK